LDREADAGSVPCSTTKTLNVAGPRDSKGPGVYRPISELLEAVYAALHPA